MNKNRWLVLFAIVFLVCIVLSGLFFLRSGLIDLTSGTVDKKVLADLKVFNAYMNNLFGQTDSYYKSSSIANLTIEFEPG